MPIGVCLDKVDLFLSAQDLPCMQTFSQTDAFAVVYITDPRNRDCMKPVAATSIVENSADPVWPAAIKNDYMFELVQNVLIKVYQKTGEGSEIDFNSDPAADGGHEFIGSVECVLASLMRADYQRLVLELTGGPYSRGTVQLQAESRVNTRDLFMSTFKGKDLINQDGLFNKSDPFLKISRVNEDNSYTEVWETEYIDNNLNPTWEPVAIPMDQLCNNDPHRPLKIEIFDYDSNGSHDLMGTVVTSVHELTGGEDGAGDDDDDDGDGDGGTTTVKLDLEHPSANKKKHKSAGKFVSKHAKVLYRPTFTDFVVGGCDISLMVAIDFTGSNGDPQMPGTLHYVDPAGDKLNPYEAAISAVGRVLDYYDTDRNYPVFGFGARLFDSRRDELGNVQHCFPVPVGGDADAEVTGVDGILQAYHDSISAVTMSGPTCFAPVIHAAARVAAAANCSQADLRYKVLLIITDGVINDFEATKSAIVAASKQPLSIVIVGVGEENFKQMERLDADKKALKDKHSREKSHRDIVQFVTHTNQDFTVLASEILAEIPEQLVTYMEEHKLMPNKEKDQMLKCC